MERLSRRSDRDANEPTEYPPPPPYTSVVYKLHTNGGDANAPPTYTDSQGQSVVYINNYPGPPLTDGCVEVNPGGHATSPPQMLTKKIITYLLIDGIVMVLLGLACIGIQIGILTTHSTIFYYYGFWGGSFLLCIGLHTVTLVRYRRRANYARLFHTFFWQMMLVVVTLGIGIAVLITENCDSNEMKSDGIVDACKSASKALNGCLLGVVGLACVQSFADSTFFYIYKKRHSSVA